MNRAANRAPFKLWLLLIIACLLSVITYTHAATNDSASSKHSPVWQALIKELPKDRGIFNRALRESVRDTLPLTNLSSIEAVDSAVLQQLVPRLQKLDKSLQKYVRVSNSLKSYQQLEKLMPALYVIEESRLIKALLKQQSIRVPALRNTRLARFLDQRIEQVANNMIFNMKALVRERRPNEPLLLQAMAYYGVEYSAKPPDFILDYQVDFEEINAQGEWVFNSRIELLNKYETPIVKVEELIVTEAADESSAQKTVLEVMAKFITMSLRTHFIEKHR